MPEIPKAVCGCCMMEMHPKKNGVVLQALNEGKPCYFILAEEWECQRCGSSVYTDFGLEPVAQEHEADYDSVWYNGNFELRE